MLTQQQTKPGISAAAKYPVFTLALGYDRGNAGSKYAYSSYPASGDREGYIGDARESSHAIGKIPSTIQEQQVSDGITIGRKSYTVGLAALRATSGTQHSPLIDNDKIDHLSVGIAHSIAKAFPQGNVAIHLRLVVTSPFAILGKPNKNLLGRVAREVKKLTSCEGFTCYGKKYQILSLDGLACVPEGQVFLGFSDADKSINGIIDLGYGTLLAAYKHPDKGVVSLDVNGGEFGGVRFVIDEMLRDEKFASEIQQIAMTKIPSADQIASMLSEGRFERKGIDFKKHLRPHTQEMRSRVNNASRAIRSELARLMDAQGHDIKPRIALVGGGSALLQAIVPEDKLSAWAEKNALVLWTQEPDYQSALAARRIAHKGPLYEV